MVAAKDLIAETVPADVLAALGLDVSTAVMPAQYDGAVVDGSCVFEGERVETKVTASLRGYNRHGVNLEVGGKSVAIDEKVRARVGLALGQAVQARSAERKEAGESLVRKAQTWGWMRRICGVAICAGTSCRMCRRGDSGGAADCGRPQVAGAQGCVGTGAPAAGGAGGARGAVRAADCGGGGEWVALENEYQAACQAWAKGWTAQLEHNYGKPEVVAGDVCADDLPGEGRG